MVIDIIVISVSDSKARQRHCQNNSMKNRDSAILCHILEEIIWTSMRANSTKILEH